MFTKMRDERGIAMVTVLLVMMVLTSLSIVSIQIAQHDSAASSYDRKRDLALQSAEQRLDEVLSLMANTPLSTICQFINVGGTATPANWTTVPNVAPPIKTYTTMSLYSSTGTRVGCDAQTDQPAFTPKQVVLNVQAIAGTAGTSTRDMQSKSLLNPISSLQKAMYGATSVVIDGNTQVTGYQTSYDADIYSGGDVTIDQPMAIVAGSVYAQGSISITRGLCIAGNVWGNTAVTDAVVTGKDCTTGVAIPGQGKVTSSTSTINISAAATGACLAGSTITGQANCAGGFTQNSASSAPPTIPFQQITYNATDWCTSGVTYPCTSAAPKDYSIKTFMGATACTDAATWIEGNGSNQYGNASIANGDYLVRIVGTCGGNQFSNGNNASIAMKGNIAIIADSGFNLQQHSTWTTKSGTCNSSEDVYPKFRCGLLLIQPYQTPAPAASICGIMVGNQTDTQLINTFAYSQCAVEYDNLSPLNGQILSGTTASITNNGALNYVPMVVPVLAPSGFTASPVYFREIKPT